MTELLKLALEAGFTQAVPLDPATIELKEDVREMCANGSCHMYGKRWSCPPGCGELDALRSQIEGYARGILVQTVGQLEDDFDGEGMLETEQAHKEHLVRLQKQLLEQFPRLLTIGAGCCTICKTCTYPDAPCRFPEKRISSMEAYGMLVTEVCRKNGMKYRHGSCTIAYTSCFLLE